MFPVERVRLTFFSDGQKVLKTNSTCLQVYQLDIKKGKTALVERLVNILGSITYTCLETGESFSIPVHFALAKIPEEGYMMKVVLEAYNIVPGKNGLTSLDPEKLILLFTTLQVFEVYFRKLA